MATPYAHPEVLVETGWVAEHLNDPSVRIVESDEDYLLYDTGHVPGAVKVDWFSVLQHPVRRDFLTQSAFEELCSANGIGSHTTMVFYGDRNNWFACYAFWLFEYYGHAHRKVMNGGRAKWEKEGRPFTREVPPISRTSYHANPANNAIRAFRDDVLIHQKSGLPLIDVRSPQEYSGELIAMPNYPQEGAQRGGHIPGALNIPWARAVTEEATFKSVEQLQDIYLSRDVKPDQSIIAYCRIGERSSHTWFVLKYLLGYNNVRNYDGSWTEWGNLVNAPIAKGSEPGKG